MLTILVWISASVQRLCLPLLNVRHRPVLPRLFAIRKVFRFSAQIFPS
jgi:hypothetical protein